MRHPAYADVVEFLHFEAELLDEDRLDEWLALLAPEINYFMAVRATTERTDADRGTSTDIGHFDDDYNSIAFRVRRLMLPNAWSENPPSRTRRFITNIRVDAADPDDPNAPLNARSYILLMRNRGDDIGYQCLSAERRDVLRRADTGLLLADRMIIPDQATLGINNLSVFL
jgi:PAH dioxygenase small subunit